MSDSEKIPSIAILMPYFGKWPFWIDLFVDSCRRNPTIDWFFFSDCGSLENFPENIKYQEMSFEEYKVLVSSSLGINFNPDNAYKICDVRPAFGVIHKETIKNYDFWGFGDLDLAYGDLRTLYTPEHLSKFDIYSNHATRISGHLCLFRNIEKMQQAFKEIPNWQDKFSNPSHLAVDERAFSKLFVKHKNFPKIARNLLKKFYSLSRKGYFAESYTTPNGCIAWKDGSYDFPKKWFWKDGVISNDLDKDSYYPYFHFAIWKKNDWLNHKSIQLENINLGCCYEISAEGIKAVMSCE